MSAGKNDNRTGYYISSEDIKKRLEEVKNLDLEAKEDFNLLLINTPNGQIKVKTKLTAEEWLKKYKENSKKKNLKTFEEGKDDI